MILVLNGQHGDTVLVDLGHNRISAFTNRMGWKTRCGMETMSLHLQLNHNRIKHMSDVLHGWSMNMKTMYCLAPHRPDVNSSFIGFENNIMKCDCVDFDILKVLHIPHSTRPLVLWSTLFAVDQ